MLFVNIQVYNPESPGDNGVPDIPTAPLEAAAVSNFISEMNEALSNL